MIAIGLVLTVAAMLLVRLGWAGRRGLAGAGWALLAGALFLLARETGAWGLAIGAVAAIVAALAIVLHAGWNAPAKVRRPAREAPSVTLPHRSADIARRVTVFVLVVPVAFAAAQWLAFGTQALARRSGAVEVDAIVLTLFLQPLLWVGLMAWQMTRSRAAQMIAAPAGAAVLGTILWGVA